MTIGNQNDAKFPIDSGNAAGYVLAPELGRLVAASLNSSHPQWQLDDLVWRMSHKIRTVFDGHPSNATGFAEAMKEVAVQLEMSWAAAADNACWLGHQFFEGRIYL